MAKGNSDFSKRGLKRLGQAGEATLMVLASRQVWFLLIGIVVVASLWLLYSNVWYVLQQEVGLPGIMGDEVPEINIEALRSINIQRPDRVERVQRDYGIYNRLFTVPAKSSE